MKKMMRFVKGKKKESSRDGDQRSESSFGSRSSLAMTASTSALNIQGNLRFLRDVLHVFTVRLPIALDIPVKSSHETVTIILESKSRGREHY